MLFTFPREKWDQLSSMTSRIIQDGGLHVCIFNKDFTRLESYFKIENLVKSFSPRELSIIRTRSDFEKHLTIKNCDKTFLKIILRLKNC